MAADITTWKVTELKEKLRELGQPVSGVKAELIQRINEHLRKERDNPQPGNNHLDNLTNAFDKLRVAKKPWHAMTVAELKSELTKYQLPTSGRKKEELLQRLLNYFECRMTGPPNFDFIRNRPLEIVMVAEKPSMAHELSKVLAKASRNSFIEKSSSSNDALPIYKFAGQFYGYSANFRMTSTFGHIFTQDFGVNTTSKQTEELFDAEIINVEAMPDKKIPKMLAEIAKGCDALVLWLDCDVEGEAICFEVIDCVKNVLNKPFNGNIMDVVYRAKFSAADEAQTAINSLLKPNYRVNLAAVAKHDLDLRIGVAFSRYQTFLLRRTIANRDIQHLSFGPCQTPCLAFVVAQYLKVQSHVVSYSCHIVVTLDLGRYQLEITSDPIKNEAEAQKLYEQLKAEQNCKVVSVERKDHVKEPPTALNTVELLKKASKHYGIGPKEAMSAAEKLYINGLISYPRTETTKYPKSLEVVERKNNIRHHIRAIGSQEEPMDWESLEVKDDAFDRGEDKGDHPPIIPTRKPVTFTLSRDEEVIYELICRHFLASFMPEQRYHSETTVFSAANMTFKRRIQEVDDYGFAKLLPWEKAQSTRDVPTGKFYNGNHVKIKNVKMSKTKGPSPTLLTEAELIEKMEKHSIGTDASISTHISTIQKRKYVTVAEETRMLTPTTLGIQLIKAYQECVPKLAEATLRAEVEAQIMKIARGEKEFEEVRSHVLQAFKEQFKIFMQNFHKFSRNFETCFELKADNFCSNNHNPKSQRNNNGNRKIIKASLQPTNVKAHKAPPVFPRHRQPHFTTSAQNVQPVKRTLAGDARSYDYGSINDFKRSRH